jgi:coenzyme F420-reducing hydrogenase alpha subunit
VEIEGRLHIRLQCNHRQVQAVEIHSRRPLQAVKIFHGKSVTELMQTLPLLYHVCGVAQASAAVMACEQAMAIQPAAASRLARQMLVWMETAREHGWRILLDWAHLLGEEKDPASMVQLQQYLPRLKGALFADGQGFYPGAQVQLDAPAVQSLIRGLQQLLEERVFAMPLEQWLGFAHGQVLAQWLETAPTVAAKMLRHAAQTEQSGDPGASVAFLPVLDEAGLHRQLAQADADAFVAQPLWQGRAHETTVLCRQHRQPLVATLLHGHGGGVMTRMVARLAELAAIPATLERLLQQLQEAPRSPAGPGRDSGVGLAQVEAARGRLVHRLELERGRVRRYQILAPTEWNFHPQGIAAQLLRRLPAEDEAMLKQQADLLINTIDPCVRYEMTLH